jgi:polar amino acid transport system substrate-binding protein
LVYQNFYFNNKLNKKMKNKKIFTAMAVLFTLIFATANAANTIKVGINATYAPLEYLDKNNNPIGFNIELISVILNKLGYKYEFIDMDFSGLIPALEVGKVDVIGSSLTIKEERKKQIDFANAHLSDGLEIATTKDHSEIKQIPDIKSRRLGCEVGTTGCIEAQKIATKYGATISEFDTTTTLFLALEQGKVDAIVNSYIVNAYYVIENPKTKLVSIPGELAVEEYAYGLKKNNKKLLKEINDTLAIMKKSGEYKKIYDKWLKK